MNIRQRDDERDARCLGGARQRAALWSVIALALAASLPSCSSDEPSNSDGGETGGEAPTGGQQSTGGNEPTGGTQGDGGTPETGGIGGEGGEDPSGGSDSGGTASGSANSGGSASGGAHSGGTSSGGSHSGGSHSGGTSSGGSHSGGTSSGGAHSGGTSSGGSHSGGTGGAGTGGMSTGGMSTGGAGSGGSGTGGAGSGGSGTGGTGGISGNVQVTDNVQRNGINCLRVQTPTADYYYDKAGAGFVSIVDRSGRDWVSFKRGGGPDGEYRGIPNMGDCCHPGYTGATTSVVSQTAQRAEVRSTGPGWEVRWEFWADKARLTVVDAPGTYYLLYEGTPGGAIGPEDYLGRPDGSLVPLQSTEIYEDFANPEWTYFLDDNLGRALIVKHGQDDAIADVYWTYTSMTVLGYGRTCKGGCTGLTASGQTLILALTDNTDVPAVTALANSLF